MSSFAFLPRSVGRTSRSSHDSRNSQALDLNTPDNVPGPSSASDKTLTVVADPPATNTQLNHDALLAMLELSLSDYALWCAPDLQYQMKVGQSGYIPMKYLLNTSPVLSNNEPTVTEVNLMQCLRFSTTTVIQARMLIAEPSRNEWHSRGHGHHGSEAKKSHAGGFEVRRKDWDNILHSLESTRRSKEWWDQRTVYIERLPAAIRSIPAISRYIESLLTPDREGIPSQSSKILVQSVSFPAHHSAPPGEPSRCKGFAFVILDSPELVTKLCRNYPWEGCSSKPGLDQDATKFGLRVMSNASWNTLKTEYLSYQQRLLSEAAAEAADSVAPAAHIQSASRLLKDPEASSPPEQKNQSSWYPRNCLVFVRNIHPETNKTTLRSLFQRRLFTSGGGVDYVDFNKGIDSCHLRLASPADAMHLASDFESQFISQCDPLDQDGSTPTDKRPRIKVEVVQGKREELYWEKVPEKLRNAALERLKERREGEGAEEQQPGKRKKRRKNV